MFHATADNSAPRMNAILVWRFMLNLQETWRHTEDLTTVAGSQDASTLLFHRMVGSLGESLQIGPSVLESEATGEED